MKRVLHVLGPSEGGIRSHVLHVARHPPPGWTTLGVAGPASLARTFQGMDFAVGEGPWREADLVHVHGISAARIAWRRRRPPVVVTVHTARSQTLGRSLPGSRLRLVQAALWTAARVTVSRAEAVIAVSAEVAAALPGAVVVPPAVDPPGPPSRPREATRAALGAHPGDVVVLAVARLHPDKRLDVFVDAVAGAGATGWIAGDGPMRAELERRAEGTGVRLLGARDDVPDLLAAADLFALPAAGEAYGIAVMEAVAAGLPVVATDVGSVAEITQGSAVLVPPRDHAGFARAVAALVRDPGRRAELAARARRVALPSAAALAAQLGAVYGRALGR